MTLLDAVWLSIIQAITEFLPVSSSGHLRLFREFFMPAMKVDLRYDLFLHIGTLLAVILYYRARLVRLGGSFVRGVSKVSTPNFWSTEDAEGVYYALMLVLGSVPTVILGLLFRSLVSSDAISTRVIGALLIVNALVLIVAHRLSKRTYDEGAVEEDENAPIRTLRPQHALVIGVAQGFAVFPGISRSGSTIATALLCGQSRERAVEFSFFLSIIAVGGATALEMLTGVMPREPIPASAWAVGFVITLFGGLLALAALRLIVKKGGLEYFAAYCVFAGVAAILLTV